ncbi:hypothetical protein PV325_001585 [Microctonus aethiopoides]|nr:hypothetical protein PV325_001585 [Microctonus aethiopoides]
MNMTQNPNFVSTSDLHIARFVGIEVQMNTKDMKDITKSLFTTHEAQLRYSKEHKGLMQNFDSSYTLKLPTIDKI